MLPATEKAPAPRTYKTARSCYLLASSFLLRERHLGICCSPGIGLRADYNFVSFPRELRLQVLVLTTPCHIVVHFVAPLVRGGYRLRLCSGIDENGQVGHPA